MDKIKELQKKAIKTGSAAKIQVTIGEMKMDPSVKPRTLDEFVEQVKGRIVSTKHFKTGRVDEHGHVVGIHEFTTGEVPHVHQSHHYDSSGRVIKLEIFEKDFTKPITRFYFYEGDGHKLMESVWLDRYGKIDNIHQYSYDTETGLMRDRAEYNREGEIFYQIHSEYDMEQDPPRIIEDTWRDKSGKLIQRFVFKYDGAGDINLEEKYDNNNNLTGYFIYEYDEKRVNLKRKEWHNPEGKLMSYYLYENNDMDYTTRVTLFDGTSKKESSQVFIYDDIGNVIREKWLDHDDKVMKDIKY